MNKKTCDGTVKNRKDIYKRKQSINEVQVLRHIVNESKLKVKVKIEMIMKWEPPRVFSIV